jgi:hypothetical protein
LRPKCRACCVRWHACAACARSSTSFRNVRTPASYPRYREALHRQDCRPTSGNVNGRRLLVCSSARQVQRWPGTVRQDGMSPVRFWPRRCQGCCRQAGDRIARSCTATRARRRGLKALSTELSWRKQATHRCERLDMIADGLDHDQHRDGENRAPSAPEPRPHQHPEKNNDDVHPLSLSE